MNIPLRILFSPSPEMASLALNRVKAENRFFSHLITWGTVGLYLLILNLVISGLQPPWSLVVISAWGLPVLLHGLFIFAIARRTHRAEHRRLEAALEDESRKGLAGEVEEIEALRAKLLRAGEEARHALHPVSPETAAEVARGEARALELVAWLEQAEPLLSRGRRARRLRQQVATQLSRPGGEAERSHLLKLMRELDHLEARLSSLQLEAERRESLLESFLLALEGAGMAASGDSRLDAVDGPIRERVRMLERVAGTSPGRAAASPAASEADSLRMQEDVRLARDLQESILPREAPHVEGLTVAHLYRPSSAIGGDFYDFYDLGSGRLLVAVGDASGHGLDSSMVSSMAKSALYSHVSAGRGLEETIQELNRFMCDTLGRRRFMTLLLVLLDTEQKTLTWVNAGQVFPLLRRGGRTLELKQPGYPLGVRRDAEFPVVEETLESGDLLVLLTDGYVEAARGDEEPYGWERLVERLSKAETADVRALVTRLAEDLWSYLEGAPPQDDVTLLAIGFQP